MTSRSLSRRRVLYGTGAGIATMMAGCSGGDGDADDGGGSGGQDGGGGTATVNSNEIHVLTDYSNDDWKDKWENEIKPGFEENHPAPVNIEYTGFQGSGEQRLSTLIQSGSAPEYYHGAITQVADLIAQDQTIPLTSFIDELEAENGEIIGGNRSTIETGGESWIIPHGIYLGGTFNYRQDVYDELGLSEPQSWQEVIDNARAIDEAGGEYSNVSGFSVPAQPRGKAGSELTNWLYTADVDFFRWADEDETEAEVWFPEEEVKAALELMEALAEFSPDPSSTNWAPTIEQWVGGQVGQCIMNNAWLAGPSYGVDPDLGLATNQTLIPPRDSTMDPEDRGWVLIDGTPILSGSDNHEGAKELARYMYKGPEKQADKSIVEPMRFIPPYASVVETDTYQSAEIFQAADGALLEKNRYCIENIAPELGDGPGATTTPSLYAGRFPIDSNLVNAYIVGNASLDDAYQQARSDFESRLEEGKNL